MPIYEYRCIACGKVFARLRSISATADSIECPSCGSNETERLLSSFAAGTSSNVDSQCGGRPSCGAAGGG